MRKILTTALILATGMALAAENGAGSGGREQADRPLSEADLSAEAKTIVDRVRENNDLPAVCQEGVQAVKDAVRSSVIALMMTGQIGSPRASGTQAGHFVADRCREINPAYGKEKTADAAKEAGTNAAQGSAAKIEGAGP